MRSGARDRPEHGRASGHRQPAGALVAIARDQAIASVEGGAGLATELLAADRVDRLLIYRAPIIVGGKPGIGDLGLPDLADAHGRWVAAGVTDLAPDRAEVYLRAPAR